MLSRVISDTALDTRPVCSCIQYLGQLDCTHILTIEGLTPAGGLNAVQQSFVRHHGAQCGFCTPGFVVSTCAVLDRNPRATETELRRGLVGNLCRCTGYEPILKAGLDVDTAALRQISSLFDTRAIAAELCDRQSDTVTVTSLGRIFHKPATVEGAARFRASRPDTLILAGGTDIGVQLNKGKRELKSVMSLAGLRELRTITREGHTLSAGACCTLADLEAATRQALPEFARMLDRFGSPPIRNAATLGGNLANGSPIGDTMPALFALNALVELTGARGSRRANINHFYTGYKQNVLAHDELITRIHIPLPEPGDLFRIYKVSKRLDLDISTFAAAVWARLASGTIADIRIALGGVAPTVRRLPRTEDFLRNAPFTDASFLTAGRIARDEIRPLSDVRGSADYRLLLAENTLARFFADVAPSAALAP